MRAKDACTSSRQYGHALRSISSTALEGSARALACPFRPFLRYYTTNFTLISEVCGIVLPP